jgi:hypothetical protein
VDTEIASRRIEMQESTLDDASGGRKYRAIFSRLLSASDPETESTSVRGKLSDGVSDFTRLRFYLITAPIYMRRHDCQYFGGDDCVPRFVSRGTTADIRTHSNRVT